MLRMALRSQGYEVQEASDGKEGLRLYRENPTDLIILDIFMPEKEGLEVIMELKREFPEVRIIAMSGGGTKVSGHNYLQIAEKLGALQTFHKPFRVMEMIAAVREILGGV